MKSVIAWIKGNLLIVISIVLILVFLPAGWVFSKGWNQRIQEEATQEFNSQKTALQRAGSVNYALPAVLEGEDDMSESRAPNTAVTAFYERAKAERQAQVAEVVERGTAFNQRDHSELVPGLLPEAPSAQERRQLALEMIERITGTETRASVYTTLLRRLNAGGPPDSGEMAAMLEELKTRETEDLTATNTDRNLTVAQQEMLARRLVDRRLGEYAGRARALSFYATTDAIYTEGSTEWSAVPSRRPPGNLTETDAFNWLWDYWVISDILDGVALANSDPQTGPMPIPDGAVKRVDLIRVEKLPVAAAATDGGNSNPGRFGADPSATTQGTGSTTHTGRTGGTSGSPFDIRMVELTVVAASDRLPKLFDALGRVNNMTVTDVELSPVDAFADLDDGYFYGSDHVIRATLTIETVWMRSWTTELMPNPVRSALGVPLIAAEGEGFEDEDG